MEPWQINVEVRATPEMAEKLAEKVEGEPTLALLHDALTEALDMFRAKGKPGRALVLLTGTEEGSVYEKSGTAVLSPRKEEGEDV